MAAPDAPATVTAKQGPVPGSLWVTLAAVTADPVVTSYTIYIDPATGVDASTYTVKRTLLTAPSTKPELIQGLPEYPVYYVTGTATNSTAESDPATETSVQVSK